LVRDELIIRGYSAVGLARLWQSGHSSVVSMMAVARAVFAGLTKRSSVRRRCDNRVEIGAMIVTESVALT